MSQSTGPGLYWFVLLYIVIFGLDVVLFMASPAVVPVVVTIADVAEVVSPSVVVSVVGIDVVALASLYVVVSAVVIENNVAELPPTAVVLFAVAITTDVVDNLVDVVPIAMVSEVVSVAVMTIGVFTCTYKKCKINNKSFETNYNF